MASAAQAMQGLQADAEAGSSDLRGLVSLMPPYIRRGFIRKVYSILSAQLAITVAVGVCFHTQASAQWVAQNIGLFYAASWGSCLLLLGVTCCCSGAARAFPTNYLFLFALTLLQSVIVGFLVTFYTAESVLLAVAAVAVVFSGLTAYACFTKRDFTGCGPYLWAGALCLFGFGFVVMLWAMLFPPLPAAADLLYAWGGVFLFSFYIVYDTQLIVGGNHKCQFDIDDYCFAALSIYLDIINLFIYLLRILGDRDRR